MKIQSKWELKGWKNIKTLSYRAILETFWDPLALPARATAFPDQGGGCSL